MAERSVAGRLQQVLAYHERTKHRLDRYAAGPDHLDWDQQPEPFRRFAGAPIVELPLGADRLDAPFSALGTAAVAAQPLALEGVATLLELSLGIAAWKQYGGNRWALRCNPSSGNLHPTEGYVASRGLPGLADGVYHYAPQGHRLERRCTLPPIDGEAPGLLLALSSIPWREAWKYGERAFRYVQLDIGHALGAIRYAAALLGWGVTHLPATDAQIAALVGLGREGDFAGAEREEPDLLLRLQPSGSATATATIDDWLARIGRGDWHGRANPLGGVPRLQWEAIDEVIEATRAERPWATPGPATVPATPAIPSPCPIPAANLIRGRRSAQAYDGLTGMALGPFQRLLDALLPRPGRIPWDLWPHRARVHPLLFVHRVEGLAPGLYLLARDTDAVTALRPAMRDDFDWSPVAGLAAGFPLFHLLSTDAREAAQIISCHQGIASGSAFSLGMVAEFAAPLRHAPAEYRRLYWEAGLLGQILYLEAEAAGLRGTGIGCFFDDALHQALGLADNAFQDLYHFTVGGPLDDPRIESLPPYAHLAARAATG